MSTLNQRILIAVVMLILFSVIILGVIYRNETESNAKPNIDIDKADLKIDDHTKQVLLSEELDRKIAGDMRQIQAGAIVYYDARESYIDLCSFSGTTVLQEVIRQNGGTDFRCAVENWIMMGRGMETKSSKGQSYCIQVKLNSGDYYCIDSAGARRVYENSPCLAGFGMQSRCR